MKKAYSIGLPGVAWGDRERAGWRQQAVLQRSYGDQVLTRIDRLRVRFSVEQYGGLPIDPQSYPMFVLTTRESNSIAPSILITGGVHGYETSGVQGALAFLEGYAEHYQQWFNFIVAPCISPWGYATINRWNPSAIDPNRFFVAESPAPECAALIAFLQPHLPAILAHIDLHETTDTDESEHRPALAARNGEYYIPESIPDGFYLVADSDNPVNAFQTAIIDRVRNVTQIAPADCNGEIIGVTTSQEGVIDYPVQQLGLCAGMTGCRYTTTTEVYPDSERSTDAICNAAQVAAICGGLDYLLDQFPRL